MKTNSLTKMASLRKVSSLTKTLALAGSVAAMAALGASSAQAQIIANFTGGNDTNNGGTATPASDTYTGAAGNGWSQAWNNGGNVPGALTGTVTNTSPLLGGGNYLSMTDSAADGSDATLTRAYGGNGVSPTVNQTITFDYRLDTSLSGANTYITVGDATNLAAGVSSSSSFIIRAYAAATGTAAADTWALYNGGRDSGGFNTSLFVNSTIAVVTGDVYAFTINLNPTTRSYTATIADTTLGTTYTSGIEGFRTSGALQDDLAFNEKNGSGSALKYSIDNVDIVPEPTSVSCLIVGLLTLMVIGYKQSRQARA